MPLATSGGQGNVTSGQIVDGTITNDDINASAAIALSKLDGIVGDPADLLSIEHSSGTTHSLTTDGNQRVFVVAIGNWGSSSTDTPILLNYDGTEKNRVNVRHGDFLDEDPFCVIYTEKPASATKNVTVTASSGTLANVDIFVLKLKVA